MVGCWEKRKRWRTVALKGGRKKGRSGELEDLDWIVDWRMPPKKKGEGEKTLPADWRRLKKGRKQGVGIGRANIGKVFLIGDSKEKKTLLLASKLSSIPLHRPSPP